MMSAIVIADACELDTVCSLFPSFLVSLYPGSLATCDHLVGIVGPCEVHAYVLLVLAFFVCIACCLGYSCTLLGCTGTCSINKCGRGRGLSPLHNCDNLRYIASLTCSSYSV